MAEKHERIVQQIQTNWSFYDRGRLFKNANGMAYTGRKRFEFQKSIKSLTILNAIPIKYGLKNGSSDLIGIEFINMCLYMKRVRITWSCHYCDNQKNKECPWKIPVFCSVEVKTKAYPLIKDHQKDWLNFVVGCTGSAYVARENGDSYDLEEWKLQVDEKPQARKMLKGDYQVY